MGDYPWFAKTIRTAVAQSTAIAKILRAILEGRKPRIPEGIFNSVESREFLQEAIQNSRRLRESKEGRRQLRKFIADNRYKAGFRTDDIALRYAYKDWSDNVEEVQLPRVDGSSRKRA